MILGINSFLYIFECHRCGILYKYSAHPQVSGPHFISEGNTRRGTTLSTLTPTNAGLLPGNCCSKLQEGFLL